MIGFVTVTELAVLMQVIANHIVDPRITVMPNAGSDRAWVWTAFDFVDNELSETVFAIRFGNAENALAFKEKFEVSSGRTCWRNS